MRRWIIAGIMLLAVVGGSGVVFLLQPGDTTQRVAVDTRTPSTSDPGQTAPPDEEVQPERQPLDLEPIEYDLAELDLENGSGALGVPWIASKASQNPDALLQNDQQRRVYALLTACFPARETNPKIDVLFAAKTACFDPKAIHEAATIPDPTDLFDAMHAMDVARPDVFTVCHNGSHKIGLLVFNRAYREYGLDTAVFRQLLSAGRGTCMGGLVHGLLDAVGFVATEPDAYRNVIEACSTSVPSAAGGCGDAVGHSVWDAFENVSTAASVCAYFSSAQMRDDCSEGMLMRMYQRLEQTSKWYSGTATPAEFPRWIDEAVQMCDTWPSTPYPAAPDVDPREGCWRGVVYPMTQPVFYQLRLANGEYPPAKKVMTDMVRQVIGGCETFPARGRDLCLDRLGTYVGHLVMFDRDEARTMCALWPVRVDVCATAAEQRIESAENGA
jgi:hypothetical protein